jgi:cephalosporin-C deacetylase-like acetyl esterase
MRTTKRHPTGAWLIDSILLLLAFQPVLVFAQVSLRAEDLQVISGPAQRQHEQMLQHFIQQEARNLAGSCAGRLKTLKTQDDFHNWQESNRETFLRLVGGLPEPVMQGQQRTPLNARVVGQTWRQSYSVRQVIYESLPQFYVTADLYAPTASNTLKPPYPAVIVLCGNSEKGKHDERCQNFSVELARRGYVALAYDSIGQGERVQYWDFIHQRSLLSSPKEQIAMAGIQEYLLGQDFARFAIWDGIRAVDYLVSLPEVDPGRIAVIGSDAGNVLSTYIPMLDLRIRAALSSGFASSLAIRIEERAGERYTDPERDVPGLLGAGIDTAALLGMIAPRPVLIAAAERAPSVADTTLDSLQAVRELYRKLGVSEKISVMQTDAALVNGAPRGVLESWLDRWVKGSQAQLRQIPTAVASTPDCTSTGQVLTSLGGNRIFDYVRSQATDYVANLETRRSDPPIPDQNSNGRVDLLSKIWDRLASPGTNPEPKARKVGESEIGDLLIEKVAIESEHGIIVPTRVIRLKNALRRSAALVYLRDGSGENDNPAVFAEIARRGGVIAVADVRGFGETMPGQPGSAPQGDRFYRRTESDAESAYDSFLIGRPLLGMRVWDALHVIEYMRSRSEMGAVRVWIAGRGEAGVVALFAAAVDANVSGVAAEGVPASFAEIAGSELYEQPIGLILPGALHDFDFADVLSLIVPRPMMLLNVQDANMRRLPLDQARRSFDPVIRRYRAASAETNLEIRIAPFEPDVRVDLIDWVVRH